MSPHHAWGLTMFENDDLDLYAEKINPDNPDQYWAIDHWQDFVQHTEIIRVKDAADVELKLRATRHGPVVNHVFEQVLEQTEGSKHGLDQFKQPIAMWWAFLDTGNRMLEGFYGLGAAHNLEKARAAAEMIHAPGLNVMYANSKGDIA